MPAIALVAVYFTLQGGQTIVALLLMGYAFVTQLFPAVVCSLMARNPMTKQGAAAGIVVGRRRRRLRDAEGQQLHRSVPFLPAQANDVNIGFAALIVNVVDRASAVSRRPPRRGRRRRSA